jgi:hypothetical protein
MKITQENKTFSPITIIIETENELNGILKDLNYLEEELNFTSTTIKFLKKLQEIKEG